MTLKKNTLMAPAVAAKSRDTIPIVTRSPSEPFFLFPKSWRIPNWMVYPRKSPLVQDGAPSYELVFKPH